MIFDPKIAKEVSKLLLKIGAVSINTQKPFRYTSGILSPMYTDNRLLVSYPKTWHKIIDFYAIMLKKRLGKKEVHVLSGTATAAIPHTAALAYVMKVPMVYVRTSKKEHGKGNLIEGTFIKGSKVVIVEDLITMGKSSAHNIRSIRESGGKVKYIAAITTSTLNAFVETFKEQKVKLLTLTDVATTLDVAVSEKYITKKERDIAQSFLEDPNTWGKRMGFEK